MFCCLFFFNTSVLKFGTEGQGRSLPNFNIIMFLFSFVFCMEIPLGLRQIVHQVGHTG